jgi:hypothetical protein
MLTFLVITLLRRLGVDLKKIMVFVSLLALLVSMYSRAKLPMMI